MAIIWLIILVICGIPLISAIYDAGTNVSGKIINKIMKDDTKDNNKDSGNTSDRS